MRCKEINVLQLRLEKFLEVLENSLKSDKIWTFSEVSLLFAHAPYPLYPTHFSSIYRPCSGAPLWWTVSELDNIQTDPGPTDIKADIKFSLKIALLNLV